jgi:hypothetical protein
VNPMRALFTLSILALTSACHSSLAGNWRASNSGLAIDMMIDQHADSLSGSGTYTRTDSATIGCGGETIPASGPVTLSGKLNGSSFEGRMSFAGAWTPPYLGTFIAPDSLNGHFMSVDRGGCPLILLRKH